MLTRLLIALLLLAGPMQGYAAPPVPAALRAWQPGAEAPSAEARRSPLYIAPVPAAAHERVTFTITEREGVNRQLAPVRGGLPFRRGELTDPSHIRLLDAQGRERPVQGLATSYWPEGTVRWLCIDFTTDIKAGQTQSFTLAYGTDVRTTSRSSLKVHQRQRAGAVDINTGDLRLAFEPGAGFAHVIAADGMGGKRTIQGRLDLSDADGRPAATLPLQITAVRLVEHGPVQATVYLEGRYGKQTVRRSFPKRGHLPPRNQTSPKFAFHGHVRVYGDSTRLDVIHAFGYNGEESRDFVKRYGLILPVEIGRETTLIYGGERGRAVRTPLHNRLTLVQGGHSQWVLEGDAQATGKRFGGWAALQHAGGRHYTTIALRHAWQQWPVTLEALAAEGALALYVYGAPKDEFLDLRYEGDFFGKSKSMYVGQELSAYYDGDRKGKAAGLLKISELAIDLARDPEGVGRGVHQPLTPIVEPARIAATKALGHIGTYAGARAAGLRADHMKRWAEALLQFPVIQHEANGLYGWVDWPDQADCKKSVDGRFQLMMRGGVGWTNGERASLAYYYHFAAGGAEKYLHLGHAMSLHNIGIDLEHPGGEMYPGTPHRHNQVHWNSPGSERQAAVRAWLVDYWMTGHPEIRRILFDLYLPLHRPASGNGPDPVLVAYRGGAENYPNLMAYLTDRDPIWIKHHKGIDWATYEAVSQGQTLPKGRYKGGMMTWKNGYIKLQNTRPGKLQGYWLTYGSDDRLTDYASLFGYEVTLKALRAFGDSFLGKGNTAPKLNRYHSPEYGYTGYYLLTRNQRVLQELSKRWQKERRSTPGKPLVWDSYGVQGTAEQWHKLTKKGYGKNGFKIQAANIVENILGFAAFEHRHRLKARAAKP
ncbi:MAG: hypothetical protein ETSY1_35425 [Candidatus Entotheonella factor]|uniref:PcRGLX/YetA-like N-terminal RIFT barrel domain-containing protein n=1 Tax=Entotheonella factor TaxID=1429438 RepID=W4L8J2_ENTF1|nr:MAG: hypothetical protein ETSY1_35425 [Candidatus Entotheonella factor]